MPPRAVLPSKPGVLAVPSPQACVAGSFGSPGDQIAVAAGVEPGWCVLDSRAVPGRSSSPGSATGESDGGTCVPSSSLVDA